MISPTSIASAVAAAPAAGARPAGRRRHVLEALAELLLHCTSDAVGNTNTVSCSVSRA